MNFFYNLSYDFSLDSLKDKMLLKSNIIDFNNNITRKNAIMITSEKKSEKISEKISENILDRNDRNFFFPKEKDTLFWCYYINKYGIDTYLLNRKKNFSIESEYKINIVEKLKNMNDSLKQNKLRKITLEDELLNKNKIGLTTLKLFMLLDKTNLLIIKKNYYQRLIFDSDKLDINNNNYKIIFNDNENYYIYKCLISDDVSKLLKNRYEVESLTKPLKSLSSYKLNELQKIGQHLNIILINQNGKNKTKQLLYSEILEKIV